MREPTLTSARKKEKWNNQERHLQPVTQRKCGSNNLKGDYCVPKEAVQEIERPELSNLAAKNKVTKTNSEENDSARKT